MTHRGGCSACGPGEDGGCGDAVVPAQHGPGGTADQGAGHVMGGGVNAAGPRGAVAGAAHVALAIGAFQVRTEAGTAGGAASATATLQPRRHQQLLCRRNPATDCHPPPTYAPTHQALTSGNPQWSWQRDP